MISADLLHVLGYVEDSYNELTTDRILNDSNYPSLNDLMLECKEWSYNQGYSIRTFKSSVGWVVDLIHEDRSKSQRQTIMSETIEGELMIEIFPRETDARIHPKHFKFEHEAVFQACQWVLEKKDNK